MVDHFFRQLHGAVNPEAKVLNALRIQDYKYLELQRAKVCWLNLQGKDEEMFQEKWCIVFVLAPS